MLPQCPANIINIRKKHRHAATIRAREYITTRKNEPCMDCGNTFPPICMDFDHVKGEKYLNLSQMAGQACKISKLQSEIEKCELVCSNCHRLRTYNRKRQINTVSDA